MDNKKFIYSEYCYPLTRFEDCKDGAKIRYITGTAFYIGNGLFMSAWHAFLNAFENGGIPAIAYKKEGLKNLLQFNNIDRYNYIEDFDIVVFDILNKSDLHCFKAFNWETKSFSIFNKVHSVGFLYSYNEENNSIHARGYSGNIVTNRIWSDKKNYLKSNPMILEVSFICPKGLSGAPILNSNVSIGGVVLGNIGSYSEIIRSESELSDDGLIIQETKFYHGFAISYESIKDLSFGSLISTSFEEHLNENKLLK